MIPLNRLVPFEADLKLPSPNHGARPGSPIKLIVLHATADRGNESGAETWMRSPDSQVSAHLHFRRDGTVARLVDDDRRAWHAGRSHWPGVDDVNTESLGWEIANRNDGQESYTVAQYESVARALRHYMPQGITEGEVVGHDVIAPGRKTDPLGWNWDAMWSLVRDPDELPEPAGPIGVPVLPPVPPAAEAPPEPAPEPSPDLADRPGCTGFLHRKGPS